MFKRFKRAVKYATIWNAAIDLVTEQRYKDARKKLDSICEMEPFQQHDDLLFYAFVQYADKDYETSFRQFVVALEKLEKSSVSADEKNYLYTAVEDYLLSLESLLGQSFPKFQFQVGAFNKENVDKRIQHLFPL